MTCNFNTIYNFNTILYILNVLYKKYTNYKKYIKMLYISYSLLHMKYE